jgi:hypothetical protein
MVSYCSDLRKRTRSILQLFFLAGFLSAFPQTLLAQKAYSIDYTFAPTHYMTPICLIDDWQKSLVDHQGALVYDFGPGPYARPKTIISVTSNGSICDSISQNLLHARVPIIITDHIGDGCRLRQTTFALIPNRIRYPAAMAPDSSFIRHEGLSGSPAWVEAKPDVDPAFRSVAWGTGRSIRYDVRISAGSEKQVALGFIDVYRSGRISRAMDLLVEGAKTKTVDLITTGGQGVPQVFFFDARDVDADGWLSVEVTASRSGVDPNVLLSGIWVFPVRNQVTAQAVISGTARSEAEIFIDAGIELLDAGLVRMDAMRTELVSGTGPLELRLETQRPLKITPETGTLLFNGVPFIKTRPVFEKAAKTDKGWLLSFAESIRLVDVVVIHGKLEKPVEFPDVQHARNKAMDDWQRADLPWDRLMVPDDDIQDLLDGGIRTIYQLREWVDGHAQVQPGATLYRGLWYGDAQWAMEALAWLDDQNAAKQILESFLLYQTPDGRAGVMVPPLLHRETAHLIYSMGRYTRLFQDWEWMQQHWSEFQSAVAHIIHLRRQTLADPQSLTYGLMPEGLTDGGVAGVGASYGSIFWGLISMGEAFKIASQMQKPEADLWKQEYEDYLHAFRRAVKRDQRRDEFGHLFLPIKMPFDPEKDRPQRGQWGVMHSIYVGHLFSADDSLVTGTMNMLEAFTKENMTHSVGWLDEGVWPIFTAHRALAYNWLGNADKAEELLYTFANHSSPTLIWGEEQSAKGEGTRVTGDIPHTAGNMQIIRLVRNLLILERDQDLELLHSLPVSWLYSGARLSVLSLPTFFGPMTMTMHVNDSGTRAQVWVQTPKPDRSAGTVRLHLGRFGQAGFTVDAGGEPLPEYLEIPWNRTLRVEIRK